MPAKPSGQGFRSDRSDRSDSGPRFDGGLSVAAVARLLGVPAPTIRSWERRYGLPAPPRTTGGHRRYGLEEVDRLRALRDEVARGRSAREAARMVRPGARTEARSGLVDGALKAALEFDSRGVRDALEAAAASLGVEDGIRQVLIPAMEEVGIRWQRAQCDVAHEHLMTEVVRSWLARLRLETAVPVAAPVAVLACGPKDAHSVGLEAFAVLAGRRGLSCRLLSSLTPTASLATTLQAVRPQAVVVTSHMSVNRRSALDSLRAAAGLVEGRRVYYAGNAFIPPSARRGVPGTYLGEDLVRAADLLAARAG
jgi:MerR family transcriptional regulator, light-induced transcriptional regulator